MVCCLHPLSLGVKLVPGILSGSVNIIHISDPVILFLEVYSSDLLASEHVFIPELFEKGEGMNMKHQKKSE